MRHTSASQFVRGNPVSPGEGRSWLLWGLLGLTLGLGGAGCGASDLSEADSEPGAEDTPGAARAEVQTDNGLSTNGLSTNGLSTNGLSTNGLSTNGLSTNGFSTWFSQDPALSDKVMEYVVRCAVPAGQTRSYTNPVTKVKYTWTGVLGLAPSWSSGSAATTLEQEVVSSCLAAHANKYGIHLPISVLGQSAAGTAIPYTSSELTTFSEQEACFFGNLFDGSGVFAANDQGYLNPKESTARGCGLSSSSNSSECLPIIHVGNCRSLCEQAYADGSKQPYYASCTYNGRTYTRPITTRIRPVDIFTCGDGTCQFTESCGTGTSYNNCQADCGTCSNQRN